MPSFLPQSRLASYASVRVAAPAEVVWATITSIDSNPSNISSVLFVRRIDGSEKGSAVRTGTKWEETRTCHKGDTYVQTKTVVHAGPVSQATCHGESFEDEDLKKDDLNKDSSSWPRSFCLNNTYEAPFDGAANTSTLTVHPCDRRYKSDEDMCGCGDVDEAKKQDRGVEYCVLSGTFAVMPSRLKHRICFALCGCWITRDATRAFKKELRDLADAAERNVRVEPKVATMTATMMTTSAA